MTPTPAAVAAKAQGPIFWFALTKGFHGIVKGSVAGLEKLLHMLGQSIEDGLKQCGVDTNAAEKYLPKHDKHEHLPSSNDELHKRVSQIEDWKRDVSSPDHHR